MSFNNHGFTAMRNDCLFKLLDRFSYSLNSKEKLATVILDVAWVKKGQRLKFSDYYSKSKKAYLAA